MAAGRTTTREEERPPRSRAVLLLLGTSITLNILLLALLVRARAPTVEPPPPVEERPTFERLAAEIQAAGGAGEDPAAALAARSLALSRSGDAGQRLVVEELRGIFAHGPPQVADRPRHDLAFHFATHHGDERLVPALTRLARSPELAEWPAIRRGVIGATAGLVERGAAQGLASELFVRSDLPERFRLAPALVASQEPSALRMLRGALATDPDPSVRSHTAEALARCRLKQGELDRTLTTALESDENPYVRRNAAKALFARRDLVGLDRLVQTLEAVIATDDAPMVRATIAALARDLPSAKAASILRLAAEDDSPEVRRQVEQR